MRLIRRQSFRGAAAVGGGLVAAACGDATTGSFDVADGETKVFPNQTQLLSRRSHVYLRDFIGLDQPNPADGAWEQVAYPLAMSGQQSPAAQGIRSRVPFSKQ